MDERRSRILGSILENLTGNLASHFSSFFYAERSGAYKQTYPMNELSSKYLNEEEGGLNLGLPLFLLNMIQ